MTSTQVVTNESSFQNDPIMQTTDTPGFKLFTMYIVYILSLPPNALGNYSFTPNSE